MKWLSDGATEVRLSLSDTRYVSAPIICSIFFQTCIRLLDEAESLDQLARELLGSVAEVVSSLDSNLQIPDLSHIVYSSLRRSGR
jgi:hypothetical protein